MHSPEALERTVIALTILSTLVLCLRVYSRTCVVRTWGVDDTLACLAWASLCDPSHHTCVDLIDTDVHNSINGDIRCR